MTEIKISNSNSVIPASIVGHLSATIITVLMVLIYEIVSGIEEMPSMPEEIFSMIQFINILLIIFSGCFFTVVFLTIPICTTIFIFAHFAEHRSRIAPLFLLMTIGGLGGSVLPIVIIARDVSADEIFTLYGVSFLAVLFSSGALGGFIAHHLFRRSLERRAATPDL